MCTKYTLSRYSSYLNVCVCYVSSENCIQCLTECSTSCKTFTNKLCLGTKLHNYKVQKSCQNFMCTQVLFSHARSHIEYSLLEHKINRKVLIARSSKSVLAIKTFESQQYIQYSQCDALVKGQQCIEEFLQLLKSLKSTIKGNLMLYNALKSS